MAAKKLVRDLLLDSTPLVVQLKHPQVFPYFSSAVGQGFARQGFSLNLFSICGLGFMYDVKVAGGQNPELKKSVKELKEKAGEFKGVKDDLRVRTKQTTEKLYKHVDGVWTEAEATAKKVSSSVKEKISAATKEV
ncbi:unnamed protein product [Linum trigynum]|uniref:Uncharacterized protein n=1 Tax=Linum trigynum TaxID=586398 RepID=A0AAV2CHA9_9ROSI